jgi:hypothetical protein
LLLAACSDSGGDDAVSGNPDASVTGPGGGAQGGTNDQTGVGGVNGVGGGNGVGGANGVGGTNGAGGASGVGGAAHPGDASAGTGGNGGGGILSDGSANGPIAGPLTVSTNPRYFQDAKGRALILAGSHTWNNLQDWGTNGMAQPFDFTGYVNFLVQHGHNFTLLWQVEEAKFCGLPTLASNSPAITSAPLPWARTGPGNADDGGLKFDLTKFDQTFFDRMRSRVSQLNAAGIFVGVYMFTGEFLNVYRCPGSDGYPLTGANNVNSVDAGGGDGAYEMTATNGVTAVQDAMADKMVDTLNDLPNVLWIVSEEASANTYWWQNHIIAHVRAYEAKKPKQHPIGLGAVGQDSQLYNTDADWVAPFAEISPSMTCGTGTPKCKVNLNDSDHSYFGMWNNTVQQNRNYAWENFVRGNQVAFMDPYLVYYPRENRNNCSSPKNGICSAVDTRYDNFRDNLGYILAYSRKLNLKAAEPSTTLCYPHTCLGQTPAVGTELLVYASEGGTITVDLSKSTGRTMSFEWFNPVTGKVVMNGTVPGGNVKQTFTPPAGLTADSVLYIVDSAGHAN